MPESSPNPKALADLAEFLEIHARRQRTRAKPTENDCVVVSKTGEAFKVMHLIYSKDVPELVQRLRSALDFLTEAEPQLSFLREHEPTKPSHSAYQALVELMKMAKRVRRGGLIRLPKTPQKYKMLSVAAVQASPGSSARGVPSRSADTESTKTNEKDIQQDVEEKLPRPLLVAYQTFEYAEANMPQPPKTDREAYDWLVENLPTDYEYELPEFDTWARYVRRGRKHHGAQKNTPRAGREGRSIVKASDL